MRFERRIFGFDELIKLVEDENIRDIRIIDNSTVSYFTGLYISFDYIDKCDKCGAILK